MIYLDNAATKKMINEAKEEMIRYSDVLYGNPSVAYSFGENTMKAVENARGQIAKILNAKRECIYFTSGGSESDNWAIKCHNKGKILKANERNIITTRIEHHAILNSTKNIEKNGGKVSYVRVDEKGVVDLEHLKKLITKDTTMISVMFANNEIGTIEPICEIGEIASKKGIIFHTDAVQAFAHVKIDVDKMNIDMLSASAHKFGGPKGVGFLYVKDKKMISSYIDGGMQERGYRAGTTNVAGIMAMAKAAVISNENMQNWNKNIKKMRDYLANRIINEIKDVRINGDLDNRLVGNLNVSFMDVNGSVILEMLDANNIYVSSMSACNSKKQAVSHVLKEIGVPKGIIGNTIRFTISEENTLEEMDRTIDILKEVINKMRKS